MSQLYPYIQTLSDFDEGIGAYSILPVADDEGVVLPEENPILAFGPLGRINIFVGATNAGKSRFLRLLAKCEGYKFYGDEKTYQHIRDLLKCVQWLANSEETIRFRITQNRHNMSDNSPVVFYNQHKWVREALKGVQSQRDYDVTFDADHFHALMPFFEEFAQKRIAAPHVGVDEIRPNREPLMMTTWARNLLQGEFLARKRDEENKANGNYYGTNQLESFVARKSSHLIFNVDSISEEWKKHFLRLWDAYDCLAQSTQVVPERPEKRFYIPVLRSAVSLRDSDGNRITNDIFEQTVRRNYQLEESLQIFTGNQLYDTIKRDRNGTPEVVARLRDFEKFLSEAFYEGRRVEIVALDEAFEAGQHISVRVQGENARELHHLGDGINTLIILLYQLFMAEPGSWVFIEEPELNLHPGLQRVFLQTVLEDPALQKRNLRVFFTTHSNHLLRMTLRDGTIASKDISVFAFQQRTSDNDRFLIRPLVSEHHDALSLLGVQNASVLLAQCGIWVEGITDRQYLRAYLNAYQESAKFKADKKPVMREDTHFAFWEYAGSNLSHYLMRRIPRKGTPEADDFERGKKEVLARIESSALCNRIFLLADRDERKTRKHEDLEVLAHARGNFVYYVTPGVEIENLLSPDQLAACLPAFFRNNNLPSVSFVQADYKDVRMGTFLQEKFPTEFKEGWVEKSGTLSTPRKNRLCELAVAHISWDTMSKEARDLAKKLYEFIAKHNSI